MTSCRVESVLRLSIPGSMAGSREVRSISGSVLELSCCALNESCIEKNEPGPTFIPIMIAARAASISLELADGFIEPDGE